MKRCRIYAVAIGVAAFPYYAALPAPPTSPDAHVSNRDERSLYIEQYRGSNARWLVDRRRGSISAWELERPVPLWSNNGVVFRSTPQVTDVFSTFYNNAFQEAPLATEIFGRVYFFLDDVSQRSVPSESYARRDVLLVALDPQAQGRLVWTRRAKDFASFFNADASSLRFAPRLASLSNDKLAVQVFSDREIKEFAINAADGSFRSL